MYSSRRLPIDRLHRQGTVGLTRMPMAFVLFLLRPSIRGETTVATTPSNAISIYDHNDTGYLAWLPAHRSGYVVNCNQKPASNYLILHRATCTWINPPRYKNWTTVGFIKVCAPAIADLAAWAYR